MKQVEKVQAELDRETNDAETLHNLSFAQKSTLITKLTQEIIEASERRYRKINDLILLTEDPKDVDIVQKAIEALCKVFLEIIPAYRLREDLNKNDSVDDETGAKKGLKLSKEVKQVRDYEAYLLESYQKFLKILEQLSKIKPANLISIAGISDEAQKEKLLKVYIKLRNQSVSGQC